MNYIGWTVVLNQNLYFHYYIDNRLGGVTTIYDLQSNTIFDI